MLSSRTVVAQRAAFAFLVLLSLALLWHAGVVVPSFPEVMTGPMGDAQHYLAAAISFAEDGRLLNASGEPFTLYPPGLPIVMGLLFSLGASAEAALVMINTISIVITLTFTYLTGLRALAPNWLALAAVALVGLNPSFLRVQQQLWTEPIFAALISVFLYVMVRIAQSRKVARTWWILAIGLVWAMIWLKFLGIVLAFIVAVTYVLSGPALNALRVRNAALLLLAGTAGVIPIVIRNVVVGGGLFGDRRDPYVSLEGAIVGGIQDFGRIVVQPESSGLSGLIGAFLAAAVLGGIWIAWARRFRPVEILGLSVLIYWGALWLSQVTTHVDAEVERFLVPVMSAMVLVVLYFFRQLLGESSRILAARDQRTFLNVIAVVSVAVLMLVIVLNGLKSYLMGSSALT